MAAPGQGDRGLGRDSRASSRVEFLGYGDSGMMGTPTNDAPESFWQADIEEAAERLAKILREESADVLTIYDDHGLYGHPDHIQVHRVGHRAAELAGHAEGLRVLDRSRRHARDDAARRRTTDELPRSARRTSVSPAS